MQTILFIEDEPTLQKRIEEALTKEGYQIENALDGEIGLQKAKEIKPALILLDIILPKKNGFDVLKELKQDEATKSIPVVILTNLESSNDVEKALELGATTYLVKANYELSEVIEKIKEVINKENES
jgi:DNA-binding response OmpR family regulator